MDENKKVGGNLTEGSPFRLIIAYCILAFVVAIFVRRPLINMFTDKPIPEMVDMAALHVLITVGSLGLLVFVNELRFLIQGVGFSNFAILAGVFEMIARTIVGIAVIPRFGFVGACLASPLAWILADMFLFPAYFYVMNKLEKMIDQSTHYTM